MKKDVYSDTTNTVAGITTPPDQEDRTATDMISETVEQMMDRVQDTFQGKAGSEAHKPNET